MPCDPDACDARAVGACWGHSRRCEGPELLNPTNAFGHGSTTWDAPSICSAARMDPGGIRRVTPPMHTRTVLVVDDEPQITAVIALKLGTAGLNVIEAHDGIEALQLTGQHRVDLVITDLLMPHLDGMGLCHALAAAPRTAHVPVMLLTARGHVLDERQLAAANVRAIVSKPFSPNDLLERVRGVLARAPNAALDEVADNGEAMPSFHPINP